MLRLSKQEIAKRLKTNRPSLKPEFSSEKIRTLRNNLHLSQAVLAAALNASLSTVRKWEGDEKRPSGPSLKLQNLVDR